MQTFLSLTQLMSVLLFVDQHDHRRRGRQLARHAYVGRAGHARRQEGDAAAPGHIHRKVRCLSTVSYLSFYLSFYSVYVWLCV